MRLGSHITISIFVLLLIILAFFFQAPSDFPKGKIITIPKNSSLTEAASILKEKKVIRSVWAYKVMVYVMGGQKKIQAGNYLMKTPEPALDIAYRTINGDYKLKKIKVTIPEGSSNSEIASILHKGLPDFDRDLFLEQARKFEGYLFPETYFFYEKSDITEIIIAMTEMTQNKLKALGNSIIDSKRSPSDIIIMAAIIEKEASKNEDREIISGILWKRIDAGMPLQVDAPFYYLLGKDSSKLTLGDLKMDSPYNTYTNKGLPPGAITNPGLDSLRAAITPKKTSYWFYLADSDGTTHYSPNYEGHLKNKEKYL